MLLPKSNSLRSLRTLFRDVLGSMYELEEVNALWRYAVEDTLELQTTWLELDRPLLTESDLNKVIPVLERLANGEPYQYIRGETLFLGCPIKVDHRVLIPRPETEELCELVLNEEDRHASVKLIDLGTGSGCIPIALKTKAPAWQVDAVEVDPYALMLARENAALNNVSIGFRQLDLLQASGLGSTDYSIIISNPPYIAENEASEIKDNVLVHEPHLALFIQDEDPLLFYRCVLDLGRDSLITGGRIYFEINERYGKELAELMSVKGYSDIRILKDLSGKDRFAVCTKEH